MACARQVSRCGFDVAVVLMVCVMTGVGCAGRVETKRPSVRLTDENAAMMRAAMAHAESGEDGEGVVRAGLSLPFSGVVDDDEDKPVLLVTRTYDVRHLVAAVPSFRDAVRYLDVRDARGRADEVGRASGGIMGGGGGGGGMFAAGDGGSRSDSEVPRELLTLALMDMARDNVEPDTWRARGGLDGAMSEQDGVLLVTASPRTHVMLEDFFRDLARARVRQFEVEVRSYGVDAGVLFGATDAGMGSLLDGAGVAALITRLDGAGDGARLLSQRSVVCFNGQWVSLTDVGVGLEQTAEPIVGEGVMGLDVRYGIILDGNRPGGVVTVNPTYDPVYGDVIITFGQELNRPLVGAAARQEAAKGEEIVYRREMAARVVVQKTTARVMDGGGLVLSSYSEMGEGEARLGGVLTLVRVRLLEGAEGG